MSETIDDPWRVRPEPAHPPVPLHYRGVWQRTLLQTSETRDDTSWVHWLQLGRWHADLRVPQTARPVSPATATAQLKQQQGFAGITQVQASAQGEVCTWHRLVDYHPATGQVDAGYMTFETPDRVIETGVHSPYHEVWQRLEGSTGRNIALAELPGTDGTLPGRLFIAGRYLMRVRPCASVWRSDFEISFGTLEAGHWLIERSTQAALEGERMALNVERTGLDQAQVGLATAARRPWRILEWND